MNRIWINRIVGIVTIIGCELLIEKYHISSDWSFLFGILWCIVITIVFEIVKGIIGE